MDTNLIEVPAETSAARVKPLLRGIHHLALNTSDMRMTLDFYVRVLGMPLVHGLRTPSPPPNAAPAAWSRIAAPQEHTPLLSRHGGRQPARVFRISEGGRRRGSRYARRDAAPFLRVRAAALSRDARTIESERRCHRSRPALNDTAGDSFILLLRSQRDPAGDRVRLRR